LLRVGAAEKLEMRFVSAAEHKAWTKNAINRDLRRKWMGGEVERLQTPGQETRLRALAGDAPRTLEDPRALRC
jgi:hypothetical protein